MASFNTHLTVGVAFSGVVASGVLAAGLITPAEAFVCWGLGALGSLLPDLDADNSIPTRIGAGLLSITMAFAAVLLLGRHFNSPLEILGLWLAVFLLFRYVIFTIFTRLTVHRGLFHSIPSGVALGLATTVLAAHLLRQPPRISWLVGVFAASGFWVHLILDEIYSIDWAGKKVRRSFGTAMKLWSSTNWAGTLALYLACAILYFLAPSPRSFLNVMTAVRSQVRLQEVTPVKWFKSLLRNG